MSFNEIAPGLHVLFVNRKMLLGPLNQTVAVAVSDKISEIVTHDARRNAGEHDPLNMKSGMLMRIKAGQDESRC